VGKARVLVVDDSVVVRKLITDALAEDPDIEVVATAAHGRIALAKLELLDVDVVTLDIEMPVMDGLETLLHLREAHPDLPVIMFSTLTERGASSTLTALERGASDYVTKPSNVGSVAESKEAIRTQLVPKILALSARARPSRATGPSAPARPAPTLRVPVRAGVPEVLVIGSSTGGPDALARVLPQLPADLPVPVLVAQHMPPVFTRQFADRLDAKCRLHVSEAVAGDRIERGRVLIAPGDWHLRVGGRPGAPIAVLDQGPQENFCRPAVDVLFRSAAAYFGPRVLAVVLTGMGSDGALGVIEITKAGGDAIVQDEETSVVWGMPGAAAATGMTSQVLPLDLIAPTVVGKCARRLVRPQTLLTEGAGA
jgi:two-component system chemotaxis response regulator CheB